MAKFYKGFNEDLTCRGFQYEEGKTYEEQTAELCSSGFHACEDPLDCFSYYSPRSSQFREVLLEGVVDKHKGDGADDTKVCARKITVGARLSLSQMIRASFDFRWSRTTLEPGASATGNYGAASATGYNGIAATLGKSGKAKGALGCWLILAERGDWDGKGYPIKNIKAYEVDGVTILADTWYTLRNGKPEKTE